MFNRAGLAKAASELVDHLHVIDNIKALQTGQKELADAIPVLDERVRDLQLDMRTLKAETKLDALREAQAIVNAVQGGLNQRI